LHGWAQSGTENYSVLDCAAVLSPTGLPLTEVAIDGGRLWPPEDPVHLRAGGYGIIAKAILATETEAGDQLEPEPKRRRLESVVVRVVRPEVMPAPALVQRPGWSSGEIVRGGSVAQNRPWAYRGRPFRGRSSRRPRGRGPRW
jgi:hypothetical protein